jgi:hypothetical protein
MARYFFNFENASSSRPDLVGRDLRDETAARSEAAKVAADLATNDAIEGRAEADQPMTTARTHSRAACKEAP